MENFLNLCGNCFELQKDILNKLDLGLLLTDQEGHVVFANSGFTDLLGYTTQDFNQLGHEQILRKLIGLDYADKEFATNWEQVKSGGAVNIRRRFIHIKGFTVPLEVSSYPLLTLQGNFRGQVLIIKDLHQELMVKVTNLVNSTMSLNEVLKNTTIAVTEHLGLDSNAIFLYENFELRLISCNVLKDEDIPRIVIPIGVGAPGMIAAARKPMYVSNLKTDPLIHEVARGLHDEKSSIGYPLLYKDELLGVIAFDADTVREFSRKEQELFLYISNQVALALYNAQLFNSLQQQSVTDGLTGLFNHRYFQGSLLEVEAGAEEHPYCVLMLDVDNFKNYNDTLGHLKGDELLRQLAVLIRKSVRTFDVVARYGGEEFAIILRNCSRKTALCIAERIRKEVAEYQFFGRECQPQGRVTVSIGVAAYNKELDKDQLLDFADQAMYLAKKKGRNRVESFSV